MSLVVVEVAITVFPYLIVVLDYESLPPPDLVVAINSQRSESTIRSLNFRHHFLRVVERVDAES